MSSINDILLKPSMSRMSHHLLKNSSWLLSLPTSTENLSTVAIPTSIAPISPKFEGIDVIKILIYSLVFLLGTPGNIYVICKFSKPNKKKFPSNKFVVHLAVVDLLSSFILPIYHVHALVDWILQNRVSIWYFGEFLCHLVPNCSIIFLGASSWFLVAISCERLR